jgi:hypothetical protein
MACIAGAPCYFRIIFTVLQLHKSLPSHTSAYAIFIQLLTSRTPQGMSGTFPVP